MELISFSPLDEANSDTLSVITVSSDYISEQ